MLSNPGESLSEAKSELDKLNAYRRYTYQGVLLLTATIMAVSLAFGEANDRFINIAYPLFIVILLLLSTAMGFRPKALDRLEVVFVVVVGAMILSRLTWHFVFGDPLGEHLLLLAGGHYWAVGIMIVGSFICLGYRRGMIAGVITFAYSATLASYEISSCLVDAGRPCDSWIYLLRIHLFLLVLLVLTSLGTHLREKVMGAFARAAILEQRAETDPLSDLANRRGAERYLAQEAAKADRYQRPFSVVLIDIDHFKSINDEHGHEVGDRVIREFAKIITATVREVDLAARWGGDEFLVAAPGIDRHGAWIAAERCRTALAGVSVAGVCLTMSVGISEYEPGLGIEDAISRADVMLYRAKAAGRNCIMVEQQEPAEAVS
jgi:diguanylate cyclase (GGDEF)-like protein